MLDPKEKFVLHTALCGICGKSLVVGRNGINPEPGVHLCDLCAGVVRDPVSQFVLQYNENVRHFVHI
jgi:hypothetical protein